MEKIRFSKSIFTFIIGLFIGSSCNNSDSNAHNSDLYDTLDYTLKDWVDKGELVGVELLITENNEQVFHKAYGWSDVESGIELENDAIWTVMSMTKPFTATAILMLMEDGLLSLGDPVTKYIPDFAGNREMSIHHLLAQANGDNGTYGDGGNNVLEFETLDDWVSDWAKQKSQGTFGEFAYSNFNYGALAYIVEKVSGIPAETFIDERIIKPLNLSHTYVAFAPDSSWARKVPSRYQWNDGENKFESTWTNSDSQTWKFFAGSLGLWMTAQDYATFIQMWLNKGTSNGTTLLKPATVEMATKIQVNAYGEDLFGHGYGWFVDKSPLVFRYGGSAGGVGIGYPDKNTVVVYLTHSSGGNHKNNFQDALDRIWFPDNN